MRKYLNLDEAREIGVIQEINRLLLHPRGLALEVEVDTETGQCSRITGIWDCRDDPEGILYLDEDLATDDSREKAEKFASLLKRDAPQEIPRRS